MDHIKGCGEILRYIYLGIPAPQFHVGGHRGRGRHRLQRDTETSRRADGARKPRTSRSQMLDRSQSVLRSTSPEGSLE